MDSTGRMHAKGARDVLGSSRPIRRGDLVSGAVLLLLIAVVAVWPAKKMPATADSGTKPGAAGEAAATKGPLSGIPSVAAGDSNLAAVLGVSTPSASSPETGASTPSWTNGVDHGPEGSNGQARRSISPTAAGVDSTAEWQRYLELTRTPLENSPGYTRPFDPEWRAVVRGRRDAPEISMPLSGGAASFEGLAQSILVAMGARDRRALIDLSLTYGEFADIVWPELPQSRPVAHVPPEDPWMLMQGDLATGVPRAAGELGGRSLELERITYREKREYRNYSLYLDPVFHVRDRATGAADSISVVKTAIGRKQRFKVMQYCE